MQRRFLCFLFLCVTSAEETNDDAAIYFFNRPPRLTSLAAMWLIGIVFAGLLLEAVRSQVSVTLGDPSVQVHLGNFLLVFFPTGKCTGTAR
jgi:hypothetical protein